VDNQNIDPNQPNQTQIIPIQQTTNTQQQNVVPRKPNIKSGLLWFSSPFLTIIGLIIFITLMHGIKASVGIINIVSFLGGIIALVLFPVGIIKGIANFSGKIK
jgi:ATP-dependent Zn protease